MSSRMACSDTARETARPRPDRSGSGRLRPVGARTLRQHARAPLFQVARQVRAARPICGRAGANEDIDRGKRWHDLPPGILPESAAQAVTRDSRPPEPGRDHTKPWVTMFVSAPEDLEPGRPPSIAAGYHRSELDRPRETPVPRETLGRQAPPCFDGIRTVNCRRPFFLRRLSTARPQRVFMRARNPCLRMRRLFRGR